MDQILVLGGGVAGIAAALDLAEQGHNVYLVEKLPSIGGKMAQLDKTFPTLDCSICILAPKMVEVARHPNIKLLTYSELKEVEKNGASGFRVKIVAHPRYVDEEKCTGCGLCAQYCPIKTPNEFNTDLDDRSAIYTLFPQAVPLVYTIDPEYCLNFKYGICQTCKDICPPQAIDFDQQPREISIDVASIIVATGYDLLNPKDLTEYGYGLYPNVLTSLEYERLLCATGPTKGELLTPSARKHPKRIAFILCVGSRNVDVKPYCSKICCMYSAKATIITKEHHPDVETFVFYHDTRPIGKGHEEFIQRAQDEFGVTYIKGLPVLEEDPQTQEIVIDYIDMLTGKKQKLRADIVVLSPAVIPNKDSDSLKDILGIDSDKYGFFKSIDSVHLIDSTVPRIYLCGSCHGPEDISTSVAEASGAAARAAARTSIMHAEKIEKPVSEIPVNPFDTPRIGAFICHCGINIGGVVNVPEVVEYAKTLPNVVYATDNLYTCSSDTQELIKEKIEEHDLNRVIVAACTPRTHEPLFRETCRDAGLNPYLFEMASIREHDSWVHMHEPEKATKKAKDLMRMAVNRAGFLTPLGTITADVTPAALVIGAGVSGMTAAAAIAQKGFDVYLIEREKAVGGLLRKLDWVNFEKAMAEDILASLEKFVTEHEKIHLMTDSNLKNVEGSIGNFDITVVQAGNEKQQFKVGSIIIATGAEENTPEEFFGNPIYPNVHTQLELTHLIQEGKINENDSIVMLQCVGTREKEGRTYCSIICCAKAIMNALMIKEKYPSAKVYIIYRDIRIHGEEEEYYWKAQEKGINFIRYDPERPPKVNTNPDGTLAVEFFDMLNQLEFDITANKVILSTPLIPRDGNKELSEMLKIPLDITNGFFFEAHPKLRPVDFATDGIYLAGTAHGPKSIAESISQALGAASRALIPLMKGEIESEGIVAVVDADLCIGCANCDFVCAYGAVGASIGENKFISEVNPLLCKGCGVCAVTCPANAINMQHYTNEQVFAMIQAALAEVADSPEPTILSFLCNWCSYAGADMAGVSRYQYPPNVRAIRVMCSGRVDPLYILMAFSLGADGVLVGGCHLGDCHYIQGNIFAEKRINDVKTWLEAIGLEPERLRLEWVSASEGKKFSQVITEFVNDLKELGATPLKSSPIFSSREAKT